MDQERTMQFIVENLAAVTASQQQAEVRAARTDRQIKGFQSLMLTGMKLIAKLQKGQRQIQVEIKRLSAQQQRTEQKIDRWLKNGSNGRTATAQHQRSKGA
jgi:hypothetical protein